MAISARATVKFSLGGADDATHFGTGTLGSSETPSCRASALGKGGLTSMTALSLIINVGCTKMLTRNSEPRSSLREYKNTLALAH